MREHEIYVVGHHEGALQKAKDGMKDRASSTTPNQRKASAAPGTSTVTLSIPAFVQDKKKLTMVAGGLAALVLFLAILVFTKKPANAPVEVAAAPANTTTAPVSEPPKAASAPAEPAKAGTEPAKAADSTGAAPGLETKVLSPTPSSAVIPPPAPASETSKDAAKDAKREGEKALKDKQAAEAGKGETKGEDKKPALPPATLVFAIQPWGEIYVNGKSRGVTPPMKSIKLEPGKYKIEVRNTTFPPHTENYDLKARDEITVRHKFQ